MHGPDLLYLVRDPWPRGKPMRRRAFITLLGCAACAALAISSKYRALAIDPVHRTEIDGRGYKLWFIGGMRDVIMTGRPEATLDLRSFKDQTQLDCGVAIY